MAYTALQNRAPAPAPYGEYDLKSASLAFIREDCTGLQFDPDSPRREAETGVLEGTSLHPNEIPYNMEKDINRLCLETRLSHFLDSGSAEDALPVYLCFMKMFIGSYRDTRQMVELLSEFENNGSSLLMKHRDHYAHSVYVFALGLAIYRANDVYRKAFTDFYGYTDERQAAYAYLEYWGMTALFHDIGYPFELPFEQVASYFEASRDKRDGKPFMAYRRLEDFIALDLSMKRRLSALYGEESPVFETTEELFAYELEKRLGKTYTFSKAYMEDVLEKKPTRPDLFFNFMDHAYFSATVVFQRLYGKLGKSLSQIGLDSVTAILLHNSLYKFKIACYKDKKLNIPLRMNLHPLAYMLMLCDELQCWDRTAYGRNAGNDLQPMDIRLSFPDNGIRAQYIYDLEEKDKFDAYVSDYAKWEAEKPVATPGDTFFTKRTELWKKSKPKLKECGNMIKRDGAEKCDFQADIETIVDLRSLPLTVDMEWAAPTPGKKGLYLSHSNFEHLYNFAVALNGRYMLSNDWREAKRNHSQQQFLKDRLADFESAFECLSLEYQLYNIGQARAFAKYLDCIGCFYSDRPVDYPMLKSLTVSDMEKIGPMEHDRWMRAHAEMGWTYGTPATVAQRENERIHPDMVPFKKLSTEDILKDIDPFEMMFGLIRRYDGLRVYKL